MSERNPERVKGSHVLIPKCKEAQFEKGIEKTTEIEIEGGIYLFG